jgi:hypothetical protein
MITETFPFVRKYRDSSSELLQHATIPDGLSTVVQKPTKGTPSKHNLEVFSTKIRCSLVSILIHFSFLQEANDFNLSYQLFV